MASSQSDGAPAQAASGNRNEAIPSRAGEALGVDPGRYRFYAEHIVVHDGDLFSIVVLAREHVDTEVAKLGRESGCTCYLDPRMPSKSPLRRAAY